METNMPESIILHGSLHSILKRTQKSGANSTLAIPTILTDRLGGDRYKPTLQLFQNL